LAGLLTYCSFVRGGLPNRRTARVLVSAALLACAATATVPAAAETFRYSLEIPDGQSATYRIEIDARHAGTLSVEATWSGPKVLTLKLVPPLDQLATVRRTGLSPQRIEVEVDEATRDMGPWLLSIYSLPTRGLAEGRLTIEVPEPASAEPEPTIAEAPLERPVDPPAPWARPRGAPSGIAQDLHALFVSTERFRQIVVDDDASAPDSCRWQLDLLRYLAEQRDRLTDDGAYPTAATRDMLQRIVSAIELVEGLRTSRDPVLTGPPPRDKALRDTWLRMRRDRLEQIESELDEVLGLLRRGHAPELTDEEWPTRLTSCLTACQRHFEQRIRLGEEMATNFELTRAQWDRLLAARSALRDLASVRNAPVR
jgi:hypothetical protein